ncbi:hypothetical protein [Saccharicrinis sp. GN24d3]|uniref:hypothetical protein n=1 Tax=Saccharicrinis sp. GN24d3 TaxID=3458416 RepID=UPI0040361A57
MKKQTGVILWLVCLLFSGITEAQNSRRNRDWSEKEIDVFLNESELIPIMINGDKDNRINIVLMNRWTSNEKAPYNSPEMRDEFIKDINESLIAALTPGDSKAQTAYANYREFFNVYGLWYPNSPEWNVGINGNAVDAMRDKLFLPWKDENLGWATFLVLPNLDNGGGGAGRNLEARVGRALIAGNGIAKMLHEIAHTCMSIGDEYTGPATGTKANPTYTVSTEYERDKIKWRKWIEPETPLPTPYTAKYKDKVGAFEGAQYHLVDYHRSTAQGCIMGAGVFDNTEKMCPICEQRVAMRVNKLVNPINNITPANTKIAIDGKTKIHFAIDHITPTPNTQVVRWILNGKTIATGTDEVDVEFGELASYELNCSITDESHFIRPDPPYAKYPKREVVWEITNSAPTSDAKELVLSIIKEQQKNKVTLKPVVTGGTPPFFYAWSNGTSSKVLSDVTAGIYEVKVTDSDYRSAKAKVLVGNSEFNFSTHSKNQKKNDADFNIASKIAASAKDKNNGKVEVIATGGKAPYSFVWTDGLHKYSKGIVYEAEDASIEIPGYSAKEYFDASNKYMVQFNEKEGSISWRVEVAKTGTYPIDIAYAGVARKGTPMEVSVNGNTIEKALMFHPTRPLYTGWEKAVVKAHLNEGENTICLKSTGKSGANIDYLRVPGSFEIIPAKGNKRFDMKPGEYSVLITDAKNKATEKTLIVPEVYPFEIDNLEVEITKPGVLSIVNPLEGYTYLWYSENVPLFKAEKFENALFEGNEFKPEKPGSYYVSAKNNYSNVESSNRICIAVGDKPESNTIHEMSPSRLGEDHIKLWFDASDLDGDGNEDGAIPQRGPVKNWMEKTWKNPGKIFTKYEPNSLNGKGVGAFGSVWVSDLGKKISGIQTVILVYKESSLTFPGKWIFRDLNKYLGASKDPSKSIFDFDTVDEKTKKASVYLNGGKIDPFNTPNPMDYCILTVEFPEVIEDKFERVEGFWEGDIAEMIFVDKALTESERIGIEEYLRKKWFAAVDLKF